MSQAKKQKMWDAGNLRFDAFLSMGLGDCLRAQKLWKKAICLADGSVRCIDGRTPSGIHLAGSGILLGLNGAEKFVRSVRSARRNVEVITWHSDCGAAFVWSEQNGGKVDSNARMFAEKLAGRVGARAEKIKNKGEDGFHHERVAYYDDTGLFDWSQVDLPAGFIISRRYLDFDPDYAMSELEMTIEIALGDHGFGGLFSEQRPFLVVLVAFKQGRRNRVVLARRECEKVVSSLGAKDRNRVRITEALV